MKSQQNYADSLQTVTSQSTAEFRDKGSRFIALIIPVLSADEAKTVLKNIRAQYPDATHVCSAWHLKKDWKNGFASDDGEPSGSAGKPILNELYTANLANVMAAVVRYYGGTKLGVPGLIHAYKSATLKAIQNAEIIPLVEKIQLNLDIPLEHLRLAESILQKSDAEILTKNFNLSANLRVAIPKHRFQSANELLKRWICN